MLATKAAPTSPNVLGTDELIEDPFAAISALNSALCELTAILLDRPIKIIKVFPEVAGITWSLTSSVMVCNGFEDEWFENVIRERAVLFGLSVGRTKRSQVKLSAVSEASLV